MAVGPFERSALRLSELEGKLGMQPGGKAWERKGEGKGRQLGPVEMVTGAAGSEAQGGVGQGRAGCGGGGDRAHDVGDMRLAQELLDTLARCTSCGWR